MGRIQLFFLLVLLASMTAGAPSPNSKQDSAKQDKTVEQIDDLEADETYGYGYVYGYPYSSYYGYTPYYKNYYSLGYYPYYDGYGLGFYSNPYWY